MGMMLTIHPEKCTGCRNCELACAMEHEGEFRIKASRIHVYAWEREAFSVPMMCQQCSDAACATVCMPKALSKDPSTGMVDYDASKCIVCSRCVRACEEQQGTFALTISGRGFESRVSPGQDQPFMDSECVSCGACVQACPTATLQDKSIIQMGQPEHSAITTCAYCGVGCGFKAEMQGTQVVRMTPWKDGQANEGHSIF